MQINKESGPNPQVRSFSQLAEAEEKKTKALIDLLQAANKQLELELSNTRVLARNLIGTQSKLFKARKKPDQQYWAKALDHWKNTLLTNINKKTVKDLPDELKANYDKVAEMIQALSIELPSVVADDLAYRFDALVYSLLNEKTDLDVKPKKDGSIQLSMIEPLTSKGIDYKAYGGSEEILSVWD